MDRPEITYTQSNINETQQVIFIYLCTCLQLARRIKEKEYMNLKGGKLAMGGKGRGKWYNLYFFLEN